MTLTFELDLDSIKMNQRMPNIQVKGHVVQELWPARTHTQTHTPDRLLYLDH